MGGDPSLDKLLAIDTMLDYIDNIFLLGNIGMKFYLAKNGLSSAGQFVLEDFEKPVYKALIKKDFYNHLVIPFDFKISEDLK